MVNKVTLVPVNNLPIEEATPQVEDVHNIQETTPIVQVEIDKVSSYMGPHHPRGEMRMYRDERQSEHREDAACGGSRQKSIMCLAW